MKFVNTILCCVLTLYTSNAQHSSGARNVFVAYGYSWTPLRDIEFANINEDHSNNLINIFNFYDHYSEELIVYPDVISALQQSPALIEYSNYPAIGFEYYDERNGSLFTGGSLQLGYTEFRSSQSVLFHFEKAWNETERDVYSTFDLKGSEFYVIPKTMIGVWWGKSVFMINFGFKFSFAKRFETQLAIYDPTLGQEIIRPADHPDEFANAAFGVMGGGEFRYHFEKHLFAGIQYNMNGITIYRTNSGFSFIPTVYSISQQTLALKIGYRFN